MSKVCYVTYEQISKQIAAVTGDRPAAPTGAMAKIHQQMQTAVGEMFFTPKLILVEGLEDAAYITTYLTLMERWGEFRRFGCHIVPANGKSSMIQPLAIAKTMSIATYVVFDSDGEKPDKNGSRAKHQKDNEAILKLMGDASPDPFPADTYWGSGVTMWNSEIGKVVEADIGENDWQQFSQEADKQFGQVGDLKKNSLHIAASLAFAWDEEKKSASLERLCENILEFAGHRPTG